jgi:23S rRNA pseudouridine1911/1915/1917 synthase
LKKLIAKEEDAALRLDQFINQNLPELSRAACSKFIERGLVSVNGKAQTKSGFKIRVKDKVEIDLSDLDPKNKPEIDLEVIYEDDTCVVINKPAGVLVHSKGSFNQEATVATWLDPRTKDLNSNRGGIVHRLDRLTSGVMICAKDIDSMHWLQKQFSLRKVKKTYIAIVAGQVEPPEAIIDIPIDRNPKKPQTFRANSNGKSAVTGYKVLSSNSKYSLIELKPTTGRTHQLRVHLNHIGHPIIGDPLYNGEAAERMYLHALELELTLPSHERKVFSTKLPKEFNIKMKSA